MIDPHKQDVKYLLAKAKFIGKMLKSINEYGPYVELSMLCFKYARAASKFGGIKELLTELEIMGEIKVLERQEAGNDFDVGSPTQRLVFLITKRSA